MAIPAKAAQLAQVTGDVTEVRQTLRKAITQVSGKLFGGEAAEHVVATLQGMEANINAWAARGTDAVASGAPPPGNGWSGWTAAGKLFVAGINDLTSLGLTANITAVADTAKDAPATTVAAAKESVHAVKAGAAKIVAKTTEAVASVAQGVTHTLYLALGIILAALALRILLLRKG